MSKNIPENRSDTRLANKSCRTFDIGVTGFEECLREGPNSCRYALAFGYSFLCHHPRVLEMQMASAPAGPAGRLRPGSDRSN
jgi:hypothetical protein